MMTLQQIAEQHPVQTEMLKASPPVAYLTATVGGLSLPDWAALLACIYTLALLVQQGYRLVGWWRARRSKA